MRKKSRHQRKIFEATPFARQKALDGGLFAKKKEDEGILELAQAQGVYVKTMLNAFGGNCVAMRDHLMVNNGVYQEINVEPLLV